MFTFDVFWGNCVLVSSRAQTQLQIILNPDYLPEYLYISYDYDIWHFMFAFHNGFNKLFPSCGLGDTAIYLLRNQFRSTEIPILHPFFEISLVESFLKQIYYFWALNAHMSKAGKAKKINTPISKSSY